MLSIITEENFLPILFNLHDSKKSLGRAYFKRKYGILFLLSIYNQACWRSRGTSVSVSLAFTIQFMLTYFHEYLHLFLKFRLGKWYCSEKSVIEPNAFRIVEALFQCKDESNSWWDMFKDLDLIERDA